MAGGLKEGFYKCTGMWFSHITVTAEQVTVNTNIGGKPLGTVEIEMGNFGPADPAVQARTGMQEYNIKFYHDFGKEMIKKLEEVGVVTEDGLHLSIKGMAGVYQLDWITEDDLITSLGIRVGITNFSN